MIDVVVVGAGPAGMAGALEAAHAGLSVLVIDEQARAGGQIFRRPPQAFGGKAPHAAPYHWAPALIEAFESHPLIHTRFRSTVYGIFLQGDDDDNTDGETVFSVAVSGADGADMVHARRVLIATGAYDMPVAFPGWTKPGVMAVGAVQTLLKSQKMLAGRNIVLAGSHPLLLVAAGQLLNAGAHVTEIVFARGMPSVRELLKTLRAAPGNTSVFMEAVRAVLTIAKHRVKISTRALVTEAEGDNVVSSVTVSKVDAAWKPVGKPRRVHADLLAIGYGFNPSTELARQAACAMVWNSAQGGWIVKHSDAYETTVPGMFVAGEPTGVAGADFSRATGMLAGVSIAESLGVRTEQLTQRKKEVLKRCASANRFASMVQTLFEPQRLALTNLSAPPAHTHGESTVVCRCELVTREDVDASLRANPFISSSNAVKLECRTGMGPCQGRYCEGTVAAIVAQTRGASIERSGYYTAQFPVKPVPISAYTGLDDAADKQGSQPTA